MCPYLVDCSKLHREAVNIFEAILHILTVSLQPFPLMAPHLFLLSSKNTTGHRILSPSKTWRCGMERPGKTPLDRFEEDRWPASSCGLEARPQQCVWGDVFGHTDIQLSRSHLEEPVTRRECNSPTDRLRGKTLVWEWEQRRRAGGAGFRRVVGVTLLSNGTLGTINTWPPAGGECCWEGWMAWGGRWELIPLIRITGTFGKAGARPI